MAYSMDEQNVKSKALLFSRGARAVVEMKITTFASLRSAKIPILISKTFDVMTSYLGSDLFKKFGNLQDLI